MVHSTQNEIEELAGVLSRLSRAVNVTYRDDAVCCGVTVSQHYIILALAEAGPQGMTSLSHLLGVAPSTLTRTIEPLVAAGLVVRDRTEGDRRQVVVKLSSDGREKAAQLRSAQIEFCRRLIEDFPANERQTTLASLKLFLTALEYWLHKKCCSEELAVPGSPGVQT